MIWKLENNLVLNPVVSSRWHESSWYDEGILGNREPWEVDEEEGEEEEMDEEMDSIDLLNYGMSMRKSDSLPLNRPIKDLRNMACLFWNYPDNLPLASVVIAFHNEGLSTLQRTVVTVVTRSPPDLLAEVLLVDDFSDLASYPHLGEELEAWVEGSGGQLRLVRNLRREGLIRSKNRGAEEAKGEAIVFLDAHCEVGINWLPPLLAPLRADPKTVAVPIVDLIHHTTFQMSSVYHTDSR